MGMGELLRQVTYILVTAVLTHLSGLRACCAPPPGPSHGCCAPEKQGVPRRSVPVPDCCRVSPATDQTAAAQSEDGSDRASQVAQSAQHIVPVFVLPLVFAPANPDALSHPVSPPLSPLLQTCLLLI
jgi:hypothetical protein